MSPSTIGRRRVCVAQYTQAGGSEPQVQTRARSADGVLSPIRNLSPSLGGVDNVHADADSDGDAVVVWEADMGTYHQVQARTRTADGRRGPLLQLSPPGQDATRPQVAVDADGDAVFAWQRLDGTSHRAEARVLSRRRRPRADHDALVDPLDLGHPAGRGQPGRRRPVRLAQHRPRAAPARPHRDEIPAGGFVHPQTDGGRRPRRRGRPAGRDRRRRRGPVRMAALPGLPAVAQGPPALRARRLGESRRSSSPNRRSPCRRRGCRWMPTATR